MVVFYSTFHNGHHYIVGSTPRAMSSAAFG